MKKLLLMAVALLGTFAAQAQTVTVDDVIALEGNSAIQVTLAGSSDVRDMQFSFVVPTGFTLGTITKGLGATDNGDEAFAVATSDGTAVTGGTQYTVVVYSENGDYLVDGVILNIPIEIPANFTGYWNETTHSLSGIVSTDDAADETTYADDAYKFQVGLLGDVNKSGDVAFADAGLIFNYMESSTTPASLGNFAIICDLNNDGSFSFADAGLVFNIIEASSSSVKEEIDFDEPYEGEFDWAD